MRNENELGATLRIGRVTAWDQSRHVARVAFWDIEEQESDWLPILVYHTHRDKYEGYADVGEKVVCLMSGQGDEFGVILGSFYDGVNVPCVQAPEKQTIAFDDGTLIQYDRAGHTLHINCVGDITIETDKTLKLKAKDIDIEGIKHINEHAPRIDMN